MSLALSPLASLASRLASSRFASSRFPVWLPTLLAAGAFVAFVLAFFYELLSYQERTLGWANGDINSRAHLAASNLVEPLRTQDIRAIQRIGDACEADGVHLLVTTGRGGVFYDSKSKDARDRPFYSERCPCGEYLVSVGMPRERVLAPFRKAIRGFVLAGLVGMAGVLLFFFVTYRQRVRIRELKRLEKFRREFIADVSHEIKTPLTGILGAVDLLEADGGGTPSLPGADGGGTPSLPGADGGGTPSLPGADGGGTPSLPGADVPVVGSPFHRRPLAATLLSLIRKESQRLNALVQSILDLARLEREGEVLHREETDLGGLVREIAEKYGVRYSVDADCSPRPRVDPQLIGQVLSNLVENAKRHSGSDDIAVSLSSTDREVRIAVEDHGDGIPPEHAARIFERFHRVDPSRAAETGGAGLGLAIVRRIARLHGGDVTYRPAVPHGSVFTLHLPHVRF